MILKIILALLQAVPSLKSVWDELVAAYIERQIATMKQQNRDAIRKAINEQDQRPIERAIGSPHAGEPSRIPGVVIVDDLPNVGGVQNPTTRRN